MLAFGQGGTGGQKGHAKHGQGGQADGAGDHVCHDRANAHGGVGLWRGVGAAGMTHPGGGERMRA
ncbi:hypothetical protein AA0521_3360 [Komagataeibacter intermedius NRIC 0521]|uniref:Uncharacterized protein n=1 Tax=Komagataeibacter intermedius NRIC 0521 TaxID=1307934 RepID=A0ABQ0PSG1_9PROT|nr:hypothetical protein AA0521_3360 [Komagataeibacter intermedius NRIC 0521]